MVLGLSRGHTDRSEEAGHNTDRDLVHLALGWVVPAAACLEEPSGRFYNT